MVKVDKLDVCYSDGHQVLKEISFQIKEGEIVGLVGTNGAGKSTLIKTLVGVLLPEKGSIDIEGILLTKKNVRMVREKIGVVFQNPEDQLFMSDVFDDIAFGPRNMGIPESEIEEKIVKTLKDLGIERLLHHNSLRLSGGEQRLVALATVMVMEPKLVLFDEPTSFLDPKTRRRLMKLLKELRVTKLIATHDLDMALELCDRVIILKEGSIFAEGKAKELLSNKELMEQADLELPFCLQNINI